METEWPDRFVDKGSRFVYYGDQRRPGLSVLDTPRGGNRLLARVFDLAAEGGVDDRAMIPPFFLFTKTGTGRDMIFHGLAVPSLIDGSGLLETTRDFGKGAVSNFEATFDVLRPRIIGRGWIDALRLDEPLSDHGPAEWFKWLVLGHA
ncbi:hypothetical protein GCM10009821_20120 [Aeromicrobium halocynthiae]|uniref:Restriction endonuclease AspBHI N-terminal domain-containing protein n=1 Tax=Aeromicrobium halocynthiae TaxID=560557 RepID=A0ABN2W328_9ACTN